MKKIVLCLFFVVWAGGLIFAQDIIVTKQSEKIEAKITDVEQDQIKYKKFSYQDGPTYTIKKSEIASIIYQNGDVETFANVEKQQNNTGNYGASQKFGEFVSGYCTHVSIRSRALLGGNYANYDGYVIGEKIDGLSDMEIENKIRSGELIYFQDMDFKNYLEKYDTEAYYKLKQGHACTVSAYILTCVAAAGAGAMLGILMGGGSSMAIVCCGAPALGIGLISIPLWISGSRICNSRVPEIYNNNNLRKNTTSLGLNVGVTGNGVGFRLNF